MDPISPIERELPKKVGASPAALTNMDVRQVWTGWSYVERGTLGFRSLSSDAA